MKHANHFLMKCSCGKVISQCRCMDLNKPVQVVQNGCAACQKEKIDVNTETPDMEDIVHKLYGFACYDTESHWGGYVNSLLSCSDNRSMASDEFLAALAKELCSCLSYYQDNAKVVERSETRTATWKELAWEE